MASRVGHRLAGEDTKWVHHRIFEPLLEVGLSIRYLSRIAGLYPEMVQGRVALTVGKCEIASRSLREQATRFRNMIKNPSGNRVVILKKLGCSYRAFLREHDLSRSYSTSLKLKGVPDFIAALVDTKVERICQKMEEVAEILEGEVETAYKDRYAVIAKVFQDKRASRLF